MNDWKEADRISDAIVEMMQREVANGVSPVEVLAAQLMSLLSLLSTRPRRSPTTVEIVETAVKLCLNDMTAATMMGEVKPDDQKIH
jgi:hypothetical protein